MNYFQLTHIGANRRETGVSPQCTDSICIGDIQKIRVPSQGKIHDAFALPVPRLEKRARPSTMLSVVAVPTHFLVVKSHFIDFLEGFKVPGFQKWNIAVHHKKTVIHDYNIFLINSLLHQDIIDFDKSEFCLGSFKDFRWNGEKINVTNYENYLSQQEILREENLRLKTLKVVLNFKSVQADMFRMNITPLSGYFISERLKDAIEQRRFTGMAFREIESLKKIEVINK